MKFTLVESMKYYPHDYDEIDLEYPNLEFTVYGASRDVDDWDEKTVREPWTLSVDKQEVYNFIFEDCVTEEDYPRMFDDAFDPNNEEDWKSFTNWLEDNFEEIFTKYQDKILDHWEETARQDAEERYDPNDYIDVDSMPGGHDDYRFGESLNEMKESRNYKGYEMRADYDVDPEEGNMSLVVLIYRNGKEVRQNDFGSELTFENYREARKWIDSHAVKCSLPDKLQQFCSIMNKKLEGDPELSVDKDEYGYYISRVDSYYNEEFGRIYFKDDYSYDYVYYRDTDVDWYEVAEYFADNPEVGIKLKRDDNGNSIGIEEAPELYDLRRDYFIPFDSSPLSSEVEFDGGLEALISISDWVFGESLTDEEKDRLLDPYDCSVSVVESINEGDNMKFNVMNEDCIERDCFKDNYNKLIEYAKNNPDYFSSRNIYDAIDNLSEEGIVEVPAEYCEDPENVTEEEASNYINDFVNNLSGMKILKLKYPVLREAKDEKICCICKQPYEGYGNNAEPVCSGTCCDECNMKEVIPARINMLKKSSKKNEDFMNLEESCVTESTNMEKLRARYPELNANASALTEKKQEEPLPGQMTIDDVESQETNMDRLRKAFPEYAREEVTNESLTEALDKYRITYYLATATRERRPETLSDIDHDYKVMTLDEVDNDMDAMKNAFMIQRGIDDSDVDYEMNDYDIETVADFVEYFDNTDWGDGSIIMLKVEGPNGVLYDTGYDKQTFVDIYNKQQEEDRKMLARITETDPDTAEQMKKVLQIESLETEEEDDLVDVTAEVIEEECDDDYTFEALDESISNDISLKRLNHIFGVE